MSERVFTDDVAAWLQRHVETLRGRTPNVPAANLSRIAVHPRHRLYVASMPWSKAGATTEWEWKHFQREIDVLVGLEVYQGSEALTVPLIAVELKSGATLNTDELDKKSAVYGPLRETYPWMLTLFIHRDMSERGMQPRYMFRNGRQFDLMFTEWDSTSKAILSDYLDAHYAYLFRYWDF